MSGDATVTRFLPGALGEPGNRTFYLEVEAPAERRWYLLEKAQVAALAAEGARLLAELGFTGAGAGIDFGELAEPEHVAFRVSELVLAYREATGMITITLRDESGTAETWALTPAQLDAAVEVGVQAVAAGRPKCPRCGLAMDPDGHVCPTTNGDLRGHRP